MNKKWVVSLNNNFQTKLIHIFLRIWGIFNAYLNLLKLWPENYSGERNDTYSSWILGSSVYLRIFGDVIQLILIS